MSFNAMPIKKPRRGIHFDVLNKNKTGRVMGEIDEVIGEQI